MKNKKNYNELQKVMLVNTHPIKLIFNTIGGGLGLYFLWQQDGVNALVIGPASWGIDI
jgi:hypothetical protein